MKFLKRFFPILFIFIVWFIFSSPYFLQNKVPFPSTYLVNFFSPWSSYPGFSSPVKNNAMPDVLSQIYPWKTFTIETLKNFQIPLWNPYSFSGTPHLANYQSAVLSPFNLLFFLLPFIDSWSILVLIQPFLAGIFMYLFLQSLKLSKNASVLGSLSFMFCGFITTWMAYATLSFAICFLPLALFAIEKYFQTSKQIFLILFSITIPLSFFSGHFQTSLYFLFFVISYLLFKFYQTKNYYNLIYGLLYSVFGILLALPQLLPSIEQYSQSLRSAIFLKVEAIPFGYLPTFIAPDFFGNPVTRNDWFGHYAEWNGYIGVIPIILAIYALLKNKTKTVLFFSLMGLISVLFSFQTWLLDFLVLLKVPVLSTSAASRIIVLFSFCAAILSSFGFDKLLEDLKNKRNKNIYQILLIFFIIFLSLWSIVIFKVFIPQDKIFIAKQNLILPTIIFLAFGLLTIISILFKNKKLSYLLIISILIIVITSFDLLRFATKWMPFDPKNLMYPNVPISSEFKKISAEDRVLGSIGGEANMYYRLRGLEGYDAVYIKRYGEFIASLQTGQLKESARSVVSLPVNGVNTQKAINLLGVKYIINKVSDGHAIWNFPYWTYPPGTFDTIYEDHSYQIFKNNNSFPRTFMVNKFEVEKNPQKILDKMFSKNFDLRNEVILEEKLNNQIDESSSGSVRITYYSPNKIDIKTSSGGNNLLFLSDSFYPGWEAFVDNKPTRIYRADFAFRAVYVPKGSHVVEFNYNPSSFRLGEVGFVAGVVLIICLSIFRKKKLPKLKFG